MAYHVVVGMRRVGVITLLQGGSIYLKTIIQFTAHGNSVTFIDCQQKNQICANTWRIQRSIETVPWVAQSRRAEGVIIKEITVQLKYKNSHMFPEYRCSRDEGVTLGGRG